MVPWYMAEVRKAHQGAGKIKKANIFIFRKDIISVIDLLKKVGGIHRNFITKNSFPTIFPLSGKGAKDLEEDIRKNKSISFEKAKNGYWSSNTYELEK